MRTTVIYYKEKSALRDYFARITADTRCMRNTACFYIRNTMTGLSKSPEERTALETEVLHDVFTSIHAANTEVRAKIRAALEDGRVHGGMKAAVAALKALQRKLFRFPDQKKWLLSYEVLDLIFKRTDNPVYRRMPSQVNQNAIRKTAAAWASWLESWKDWRKHPEKYQAETCGIPVICREESYTSKASLLDLDPIPVYGKDEKGVSFSGKRIKRGLYQSADGTCLNADVNGAGNILRKQYPDAFAEKDLSYLWRTTRSVNLSSLYVPYRTGKEHRSCQSGISSRLRHETRKQIRLQLLETFQAGKKIWQPERTAV